MNELAIDVYVLMSGGLDSTACAHYFRRLNHNVTGVFIDYGQPAVEPERQAVNSVTEYLEVPLTALSFKAGCEFGPGEIIGRNAFLIFSAVMGLQLKRGIISLGIHANTDYYDCGEEFVSLISKMLGDYSSGQLVLNCPFINQKKSFISSYARTEDIPIGLTYSCEAGTTPPCQECLSCKDRNELKAF